MTSNKDNWETPPWLFSKLDAAFKFELDAAASKENHLCPIYITKDIDALRTNWKYYIIQHREAFAPEAPKLTAFLNPPYGGYLLPFFEKVKQEHLVNKMTVVCLVPARTDTKWFKIGWDYASQMVFLYGRLKFEQDHQIVGTATFPSTIIVFSDNIWDLSSLKDYGKIITLRSN